MGFTKRFVDEKTTKTYLNKSDLKSLFSPKVDMFIFMDTFSQKVFDLFKQGESETQIQSKLNLQTN